MTQLQEVELGNTVFSDTVCVTDPCYGDGTWCGEFNLTIKPGTYTGKALQGEKEGWGNRNWRITAIKQDEEITSWIYHSELGVDAGTMSILNKENYDEISSSREWARFDEIAFMIESEGFICNSGLGDGVYGLYEGKNAEGDTIGIAVLFLIPWEHKTFTEDDRENGVYNNDPRLTPFVDSRCNEEWIKTEHDANDRITCYCKGACP